MSRAPMSYSDATYPPLPSAEVEVHHTPEGVPYLVATTVGILPAQSLSVEVARNAPVKATTTLLLVPRR